MIVNILVFASYNFNKSLDEIKKKLVFNLVMYDSKDYLDAVQCGSTFVRIGSAIFGDRVTK